MTQRYDDQYSRPEWRNRDRQRDPSQSYGQREPYNASGYGRGNASRYSESQYGQRRPWRDPTGRDFGGGGFRSRGDDYSWRGPEYSGGGDYGYDRYAPTQRPFNRGPKGYQRSDERLKEDISERLMQSEHVDSSDVTVNVIAGKITLEGNVPTRYMKHYIEDLADGCPGVQDIENRIRVR